MFPAVPLWLLCLTDTAPQRIITVSHRTNLSVPAILPAAGTVQLAHSGMAISARIEGLSTKRPLSGRFYRTFRSFIVISSDKIVYKKAPHRLGRGTPCYHPNSLFPHGNSLRRLKQLNRTSDNGGDSGHLTGFPFSASSQVAFPFSHHCFAPPSSSLEMQRTVLACSSPCPCHIKMQVVSISIRKSDSDCQHLIIVFL